MSKTILWFILPVFLFGCAKKPVTEVEPNNTFSQATEVELDKSVIGFINSKYDKDYFKLTIPLPEKKNEEKPVREKILRMELSGIDKMNLELFTYDEKQELLKRCNDQKAGEGETLANIGVIAEKTYFIKVSEVSSRKMIEKSSAPYQINFILTDRGGNETEPNDKKVKAIPLALNKEIKGYFNPAKNLINKKGKYSEEDWYVVKVDQRDFLLDFSLSGVPGIDSLITIYDEYDYKLAEIDNYGYGEGESYSYLATAGSKYTLLVKSKKLKGNSKTPYILKTNFRRYDRKSEKEPNNSRSKATPIQIKTIGLPGKHIIGYINPGKDTDWYKLKVRGKKHVLNVKVAGVEAIDTILEFRDKMGNLINKVNNRGAEQTETLSNAGLLPDNDYYLVIKGSSHKESNSRQPYQMTLILSFHKTDMEFEPNNKKSQAQIINVGKIMKGYLSPLGDEDWYKLNVYSEVNLKFSVTAVPEVTLTLNIFSPAGETINSIVSKSKGAMIKESVRIPAGDFYIQLRGDTTESNVRDEYILSITQD